MTQPECLPYDRFIRRRGRVRTGRWRRGATGGSTETIVTVGHLGDGAWWVEDTRRPQGVAVWRAEPPEAARGLAEAHAGRLMADGEWEPLPIDYGPDGRSPVYADR